jgi:flagellar biosynthesis/type III secretory pathway M-ring protein FliF/YscJ
MILFHLIKNKITTKKFITIFFSLLILIIISIQYSIQINNSDKFVLILKDLSPKSVGEVVEKLKEQRITYEIRDAGRSIFVLEKQDEEAVINLVMVDLPDAGKTAFEIFGDKTSVMLSSEFEKRFT